MIYAAKEYVLMVTCHYPVLLLKFKNKNSPSSNKNFITEHFNACFLLGHLDSTNPYVTNLLSEILTLSFVSPEIF